jgi:urease accessory protein
MPLATKVIPAADRTNGPIADTLILTFAQRTAQRGFVFGVHGACIEFDFAEPVRLRHDDVLMLDNGTLVEVVAEPEPLIEVRVADPVALARLAWNLGDCHVPVEIKRNRLRLRSDPQLEALLRASGAQFIAIEAPFEPDGEAQAANGEPHHDHHHHDGCQHHSHDHHDH